MRRRLLESFGVVTVFVTITVTLHLTSESVGGQAPASTAWGHSNLEGIWLDVYATPFERAPEFGTRELATAEERSALDQVRMGDSGRDRRGPPGSSQDVSGAYNAA